MALQMTKSPILLAKEAMKLSERSLPAYSSVYSRRDYYTQSQLFTLVVLKHFFKTDYRGIVQLVGEFSELQKVIGLKSIPHFVTLCRAENRLLKKEVLRAFLENFLDEQKQVA